MVARVRLRSALALLAAAVLGGVAGGCGTAYQMPTEIRTTATTAGQGTYQRLSTWTGMTDIQDILLSPGGELYLLFQNPVAKTGHVQRYLQSRPAPLGSRFPGLMNPTAVCFGANRIFVLDQGDTNAARSTFPCYYSTEFNADVDSSNVGVGGFSRPITALGAYWHVRQFLLDGKLVDGFTDTTFAWVNGIAADAAGNVYVSGVIIYCDVSPFDPSVRSLEFRYRIRRYLPGSGDRYVVSDSTLRPWRRDYSYRVIEGTGIGSTKDPRGMQWSQAAGAALYFADRGNNQVQKYGVDPFKIGVGGAGSDSMLLMEPSDVAVDSAGYVYVLDTGHHRVLRYEPDGSPVRPWGRVDRNPEEAVPPLALPTAVAADNRQVYVADRGAGEVLRYWRRD